MQQMFVFKTIGFLLTTVTVIRTMKRTKSAMFCQSHDRGFSMLKLHGTLQQTQQVVTSTNNKSIGVFRR